MTIASSGAGTTKNALVRTVQRTSGLAAPIVSLGGAHRVSRVRLDVEVEIEYTVLNMSTSTYRFAVSGRDHCLQV